jgi:hypothetical protein
MDNIKQQITQNIEHWILNDEGIRTQVTKLAQGCSNTIELGKAMVTYFDENLPEIPEPFDELLALALGVADWYAIAQIFEEFLSSSEEEE